MKFKTIYSDPPWPEKGGGKIKRGADRHYPLMEKPEILLLPVDTLADENAHLYLWTTANYLDFAQECIKRWNFRYIRYIVWVKSRVGEHPTWLDYQLRLENPGLGQYIRGVTELCLFAVRGKLPYRINPDGKRAQGIDVIFAPRQAHSVKPEEMRKQIELVSHGPYLEMFARRPVKGWSVWGRDVDSNIEIINGVAHSLVEAEAEIKAPVAEQRSHDETHSDGQPSLFSE